jgi:hypothetical protein
MEREGRKSIKSICQSNQSVHKPYKIPVISFLFSSLPLNIKRIEIIMSEEERVTRWTFDKACSHMEHNVLHKAVMSIAVDVEDTDLLVLGVLGASESQKKKMKKKRISADTPVLTGQAKELDTSLDGILSEAMTENLESFKNGCSVGSTIPTIRVASSGKVSFTYLLELTYLVTCLVI